MATSGSHGGEFTPAGPTHNYEYEPDKFAVKTIAQLNFAPRRRRSP